MKNKKVENALLDIAAELVVSPIALYAKANQITRDIKESETCKNVNTTVKQAGADISAAAKTLAESETGQLVKDTVSDTTEKVKETAVKVKEYVVDVADDAISKTKETVESVKDFINDITTEAEAVEVAKPAETAEPTEPAQEEAPAAEPEVLEPEAPIAEPAAEPEAEPVAEPEVEPAPAPAKRGRPKKTEQ